MSRALELIKLLEGTDIVSSQVASSSSDDTSSLSQLLNTDKDSNELGGLDRDTNSKVIGSAIQNIIDNLGSSIPLELAELVEDAIKNIDPNGDLSIGDAVSKLRNDDAQKLYFDIKSYLDKNSIQSNQTDQSNGIAQTAPGVVAQQPNDVVQQTQSGTEQ